MTPNADNDTYPEKVRRISQSNCILWTGRVNNYGYGIVQVEDGYTTAHRAAWVAEHGPLPHELVVDHLCRNRLCVNLDHLEAVTYQENTQRAPHVNKTHCPHGHALDGGNVYVQIDRRGHSHRSCRTCRGQRSKNQES